MSNANGWQVPENAGDLDVTNPPSDFTAITATMDTQLLQEVARLEAELRKQKGKTLDAYALVRDVRDAVKMMLAMGGSEYTEAWMRQVFADLVRASGVLLEMAESADSDQLMGRFVREHMPRTWEAVTILQGEPGGGAPLSIGEARKDA